MGRPSGSKAVLSAPSHERAIAEIFDSKKAGTRPQAE